MAKDTTVNPVTGEIEIPDSIADFEAPARRHEVLGVVSAIGALFLLLSLVSYEAPVDGNAVGTGNLVGIAGQWTAHFAFTLIGLTAYLLDGFLWMGAFCLFRARVGRVHAKGVLGILFVVVLSAVALNTALRGEIVLGGLAAGGFVGEVLGEILISLVSVIGAYLVTLGGIVVIMLLVTDISLTLVARSVALGAVTGGRAIGNMGTRVLKAWKTEKNDHKGEEEPEKEPKKKKDKKPKKEKASADEEKNAEDSSASEPKIIKKRPKSRRKSKKKDDEASIAIDSQRPFGEFQLPSPSLLTSSTTTEESPDVDEQHLKETAEHLVRILGDFGVTGEVREIHPGPVVTMFEFQPKSGTKLSKIEGLSSEIAMALEVLRVRVVAPIPGKNAVGFELPNDKRETVFLKEMITDETFSTKKRKLPLALGKDISGISYYVDLAKMPHLLIAGTTGSGKSVSLNAMLLSLLFKYTPDKLRFLMVDPKMIELGIYDGIPHLLLPVVTDMSKACLALKWAVDEMERRYQLFADLGVRNLSSYNKKIEKLKTEHSEKGNDKVPSDTSFTVKDEEVVVVSDSVNPEKLEKLPYIVTVVDELADLMMSAAKDVETSIARLAQKARAAGIHLIIATQRPSVDVITGLIKANFPSRISFRVSSGHDSRTILGTQGAENLLGMGDMLIMPPGTSDLTRVHGAFVEDDDIHEIVTFLKAQGNPEYDEEILKPREDEGGLGVDEGEKDEIYDQAVAIVADSQVCSISMLQRRLRIGYNRSARIVEIMEKEGVVGPANGVNKREVLISPQ
ncbi:MAG: DNA translocase FtsK [Deltaproteobacteria bacterium]|nr:DNA translocase FtsK [Deltaproteobacteria bacterium]